MTAETREGAASGSGSWVYLPLVLTMVFWGSAFATSRLAVTAVGHDVAAFLRYGAGALILVAALGVVGRGAVPLSRRTWTRLAAAGAIGIALYNALFFLGLSLAPAIDGATIMPIMSPVFTALLASLILRERPTPGRLAALALGIGGAVAFLASASVDTEHPQRLLGDAVYLGASFCWAIYTLMGRRLLTVVDPLRATTWATIVGALLLGLVALPQLGAVDWGGLSGGFWLDLAYLAVFPTALAYVLFYRGVRDVGPTTATVMMFLVPVTGALFAAMLLGETLQGGQLVGAAAMVSGALLAVRSARVR